MSKANWWDGKSDAEIQKHYDRETSDFYTGYGNYAPSGECHHDFSDDKDISDGSVSVLDSLCEESESVETNADIASVAMDALRSMDAADKRCRYTETLTALTMTEANLDTGRHNMSDLARVLGVSRPTAIGRYRKLMDVLAKLQS